MDNPDPFLDALLALPDLSEPVVSPDRRWVAWAWFRVGPAADVYVAPTDGSAPPLRLTDTLQDTLPVAWTPDSEALIVEQDCDGDERVQLFRVARARPLAMEPLTEAGPSFFLRGGEPHPNRRWLIYGANYDFARGQEIEPTWLYRHDLASGERRALACPLEPNYYEPELNASGTHVLYFRADRDPSGQQVWVVDVEGNGDREILNAGDDVKMDATWCADGERVLCLAEAETHRRVGVYGLRDGGLRWLLDDAARNIEEFWVPKGSPWAVLVDYADARPRASLLDPESGAEILLPPWPGNAVPLAPAAVDGRWIVEVYNATQPADLRLVDLEAWRAGTPPADALSLTRVWEWTPLRPQDFVPAEAFRWTSSDGRPISGWLYRGRGDVQGTVIYVHGGPTAHSEDRVHVQIQFLASRGFHVLDPNYRGSTGYGLEFMESIKEDGWGGREQEDIRSGIEALMHVGLAAPGQVGITGTSYGGYSAWHAITHFPPGIVAAAAPVCGMTDLAVDYETTRPDLRPYSEEMLGGSPDEVPERYRERSPIHFVDRIRGRLLIVQGLQDPNVTPDNVRAVREALDAAGVAYEVLAFDDEGHGISRPRNLKILCRALERFFRAALAGQGLA